MPEIMLTTNPTQKVIAVPYLDTGVLAQDGISFSSELLAIYSAKSKLGSITRIPLGDRVYLLVGLGSDLNLRNFGAALAREAQSCSIEVPNLDRTTVSELVEGLALGGKTPTRYKATSSPAPTFEIVTDLNLDIAGIQKVCSLIVSVRELINLPANALWPEELAQQSKALVSGLPIEVEIWDELRLEQERCGGILGVGKGSVRPPRLVKLTYKGGGKHLALVGKGITFDTGGLSLKPAESMVGMKYDMAGSATVLGVIAAVAALGLKVDVTAFMCIAENMPSGSATRPGDVITIRNGKTVEVLNTDAEGRLVLADGLSLAQELNPDHIIDVATLTGAATIALGNRYAGVMGQGAAVGLALEAAKAADELLWEMPLPAELRSLLDSELADMTNVKIGNRAGGMLVGGHFLKEFVSGNTSWAHLDIAGPANNDSAPYGVNPQGATGVMIRTLVEVARKLSQ